MANLLKDLAWKIRYPWPRSVVEQRLRPVRISVCPEERFAECLALYQRNEAHGIPAGDRQRYLAGLRSGAFLSLIAEEDGRLVGTFNLVYDQQPDAVWLCYIMTCPEHHRRGIGTTMLMTAIALLPENERDFRLCLSALPGAVGFYDRFGFRRTGERRHPDGQMLQVGFLMVTSAMIHSCREWLSAAGATLPQTYTIPVAGQELGGMAALLRLSAQRALWGRVPSALRSVSFTTVGERIYFRCYFEPPASDEDKQLLSRAAAEVIADFPAPWTLTEETFEWPRAQSMQHLNHLVYLRHEPEANGADQP